MAEPNLLARIWSRGTGQKQPKRRWNCPSDGVLAAYLDGALDDAARVRLQEHLAGCLHCRELIADIVKLQREADLPAVPVALVSKARALVLPSRKRWVWNWATVATAGTLACAVIAMSILRHPQGLNIPESPAPAAPVMPESKPSTPAGTTPGPEIVRTLKSPEHLPTVLFPQPDKVIPRKRLEFRWNEVPDSLYYQVRVLTSEGDLAWEADSTVTQIRLPNDQALNGGKYFVLVSAVMKNGRTKKSDPVRFQVADSR
jgi:hypothetical protein